MTEVAEAVTSYEAMPRPSREENFPAWLVPARNNIQREMLRLRPILRQQPLMGSPIWTFKARHEMVGSCFSLWRAVFQAKDAPEDHWDSTASAKFLDQLIYNNAATYANELNAWSLQYYIENAVYRIRQAREIAIAAGVDPAELPEARMIFDKNKPAPDFMTFDPSPYAEWEESFLATRALITAMANAFAAREASA